MRRPGSSDFFDSMSPLRDVAKTTAPLFVHHGVNDPRVSKGEADQVVVALRARKLPVEYMVAPDEGHSLARRANVITFLSRAARFLESRVRRPR